MAEATLADLMPDPNNARSHGPRNVGMIADGMGKVGAARSIVIDEQGRVLAGNATVEAAAQAGIERVQIVDADGNTLVAVRRSGLTETQKRQLAYYDNRAAELAEWNPEQVAADAADGMQTRELFSDAELMAILAKADTRAEYGFLDAIPTGDAPVAEAREQRGYPLAIVLTRDEYEAWGEAKQRLGVRGDKAALLALARRA